MTIKQLEDRQERVRAWLQDCAQRAYYAADRDSFVETMNAIIERCTLLRNMVAEQEGTSLASWRLMEYPEQRIVDPRGPSVRVGVRRFTPRTRREKVSLCHYAGQPVKIKVDLLYWGEHIYLYSLDDEYICTAAALAPACAGAQQ